MSSTDVLTPELDFHAAAIWREAIDHVLRTGEERWLERTIDTPRGPRRYSARMIRLSGTSWRAVCARSTARGSGGPSS